MSSVQIGNTTLILDGVEVAQQDRGTVVVTDRVNGYRVTVKASVRIYTLVEAYSDQWGWNPLPSSKVTDSPSDVVVALQEWYLAVMWLRSVTG